nr:uncharacterized mitochondrial protein AtMg00810-like [Aegilops tauschii subsp. strangulata]
MLLLYVDDIVITASRTDLLRDIIGRLGSEFRLKDLGALHFFLDINVRRDASGFFLHQGQYALDLLDHAGMTDCKPAATPAEAKPKLSAIAGQPATGVALYRSIVGALQYLTLTRPDILFAVQQVCLHMHSPCDVHWSLVKHILRYIRDTPTYGLRLHASASTELFAYTDVDWAGCPDTRQSTSDYLCLLR